MKANSCSEGFTLELSARNDPLRSLSVAKEKKNRIITALKDKLYLVFKRPKV